MLRDILLMTRKQVYSRLVPRWRVPAIQNRPDYLGLAWNRRQTGRALCDGKPADLGQRPLGCVHVKPVRQVGGLRPEFSPGGREMADLDSRRKRAILAGRWQGVGLHKCR